MPSNSDGRVPVFREMFKEVRGRRKNPRATVVGITGIDGSGKTEFAKAFGKYVFSKGWKVQMIHLDDFHCPKSVRYCKVVGGDDADRYYKRSFDISRIVDKLLLPIHNFGRPFYVDLPVFDLEANRIGDLKRYEFDRETIAVFEGVFLFRNEFAQYIDYMAFMYIPFEEGKERALRRDGQEMLGKYMEKYYPAQLKYMRRYSPADHADIIIDNTDWEEPEIKKKNY